MSTLVWDLIAHVESVKLTQGKAAGQNLKLHPWQRRFLHLFGQPGQDLFLSVARGAGKSTLAGALADASLCGPLAQPRGEVVIVASSFQQARIVFEALLAGLTRPLSEFSIRNSQSHASVTHKKTGARVRALGNSPPRLMGLAPNLAILDEPASWQPTTRDAALNAIRTSLGKIENSRLVAIGTQSSDPSHWFQKALKGGPGVAAQVHAAGEDDPPFRYATWCKACPSLKAKEFEPLRERVAQEAAAAKQDPALLQSFRALRLNQPVPDVLEALLLSAGTWAAAEGDAPPQGKPIFGVDLGTSAAQSAISAFWPSSGRLDGFAIFPAKPSLAERGMRDGCGDLYQRCHERNELLIRGDLVSDIPALLDEAHRRYGSPSMIVTDRWREAELRQCLQKSGFPLVPLVTRGMGFKDGGEDVRAFQRAVVSGKVTPVESLLLRSAMAEARTISDPSGTQKLAKGSQGGRRSKSRDDAAAAAILAVSAGVRLQRTEPAMQEAVLV